MTAPECTPIKSRGLNIRIGRYHLSADSPARWGASTIPRSGSCLGVMNCRTPVAAIRALRRAERKIPAA